MTTDQRWQRTCTIFIQVLRTEAESVRKRVLDQNRRDGPAPSLNMPTELPGFYWDEARNRYFPISSRPKQSLLPPPPLTILDTAQKSTQSSKDIKGRLVQCPSWSGNETIRTTNNYTQRWRASHDILCSHYTSTSLARHLRAPVWGVRAFSSTTLAGKVWRFLGDSQGWLYSHEVPSADQADHWEWSIDLNLQPSFEISSISTSGSRVIATSLGPGKFSVQDFNLPGRTFLISLHRVSDIRASHLQNQTLVLGARKSAVYISDVDVSTIPRYLNTNSDIFSVFQQDHLVYTGARNGTIERFDKRIVNHRSEKLFDTRFADGPRSPVLYLNAIRESELLISHLNGDLVTYDLRFSSIASPPSPVRLFASHINSYTDNLGIAIDHDQDILFAAGQDCHIRAWSLRTAAPLLPPLTCSSSTSLSHITNPFSANFPEPVRVLQVTQELGSAGTCLWAACDKDIFQFHLGQHSTSTDE